MNEYSVTRDCRKGLPSSSEDRANGAWDLGTEVLGIRPIIKPAEINASRPVSASLPSRRIKS